MRRMVLAELPDHTEVWRYMDMWKFMSLLETSTFYFSRLDTLEDPFDGQLRPYELPHAKNLVLHALMETPSVKERFEASWDKLLRQGATSRYGPAYVSCWHVAKHSSIAMWKLYCPSGQGVAIVSTVGKLRELADLEPALAIGKVEYESVKRLGRVDKWEELLFLKRREYEFEREVRMVLRYPLQEHLSNDFDGAGVRLPVDITDLIRKVWIPAGGTAWQQSALASIIQKLGLKVEIGRSRLLDDYWGDEARIGNAMLLNQLSQLENPDSRILLVQRSEHALLESFADSYVGFQNGDSPRWLTAFWELPAIRMPWNRLQNTTDRTITFFGCDGAIRWEDGGGEMASNPQVLVKGTSAWSKTGVLVRLMREFPCCIYTGQIYDQSSAALIPKDPPSCLQSGAFVHLPSLARRSEQSTSLSRSRTLRWFKSRSTSLSGKRSPLSDIPTGSLSRTPTTQRSGCLEVMFLAAPTRCK
jgi:hypothetical protein